MVDVSTLIERERCTKFDLGWLWSLVRIGSAALRSNSPCVHVKICNGRVAWVGMLWASPNPRAKCNGKSTKATFLQYIQNEGYIGNDAIEVETINDAGQRTTYTYNITVKR
jgi:hypothetical protein